MVRRAISTLALSAYFASAASVMPLQGANGEQEVGRGPNAGLVCASCIIGGIVVISSGAAEVAAISIITGGAAAVKAGAAVTTCVVACTLFLEQ